MVLSAVLDTLEKIINHSGDMFGATRKECGNYRNLSLESAKIECERYTRVLKSKNNDFKYKNSDE